MKKENVHPGWCWCVVLAVVAVRRRRSSHTSGLVEKIHLVEAKFFKVQKKKYLGRSGGHLSSL